MTKTEMVKKLAQDHGMTQGVTQAFLEDVFALVAKTVANNGEFRYPGFGTFRVVRRAARTLNTGIYKGTVAACNTIKFAPAKDLKDKVN